MASVATHATLASYVVQAEYGDSGETAEYNEYMKSYAQTDDVMEKLKQLHLQHKVAFYPWKQNHSFGMSKKLFAGNE